jgi:hypothetical protein
MNIYQARYRNALKKAAKINRLMKKGYHVFFDGSPDHKGFVMLGDELCLKVSDNSYELFYQNSADWDHGYYTPIKEWNKKFTESFEVYQPSAKIKL